MVTSPDDWKILESDEKLQTNKQTNKTYFKMYWEPALKKRYYPVKEILFQEYWGPDLQKR